MKKIENILIILNLNTYQLKDKVGKLPLKSQQKTKTPKHDYVLISASTMLNMKIWLVEGLETAAMWFLPSCARKYLAPTGQGPFSHRFVNENIFSLYVNRFHYLL